MLTIHMACVCMLHVVVAIYYWHVFVLKQIVVKTKTFNCIWLRSFNTNTNKLICRNVCVSFSRSMDFCFGNEWVSVFLYIFLGLFMFMITRRRHKENMIENVNVFVRSMCITHRKIVSNYCFKGVFKQIFFTKYCVLWCHLLLFGII